MFSKFRVTVGALSAIAILIPSVATAQIVCVPASEDEPVFPTACVDDLGWWPYFGARPIGSGDPCAGTGSITYTLDSNGLPDTYSWSPAHPEPVMGGWFSTANQMDEAALENFSAVNGVWNRAAISTGSKRNIGGLWTPSPGDFLNPAKTIGESSFALLPAQAREVPTDWNGVSRPTLEGVVDLVTGAPLISVTDLTLPFGGAEFRLTRTRSAPPNLGDQSAPTGKGYQTFPTRTRPAFGGVRLASSDMWWDWTGVGWMASENPVLILDSAVSTVVGDSPRTSWFVVDAHHSIPFQLIESNGTYEAPPRFRARMEHNGTWHAATRSWSTLPSEYKIYLYEDRLVYTFVPIREDVPPNAYDDGPAFTGSFGGNCVQVNQNGQPLTLHDRPFLSQHFPDPSTLPPLDERRWWDPRNTRTNPGLGIPFYALCTRIEDSYGHRADIYFCDVPTYTLETGVSCATCWEDSQRKGQINYIKLSAPDAQGGYETTWTLLYAHRRFRGGRTTDLSRDSDPNAAPNELYYMLSQLDTTGTDVFNAIYPEIEANAALYSLRGNTAIDRIYVYEGDVSSSSLDTACLTISHLDEPRLNGGADPLDDHNQSGGTQLPTDWRYAVRYHYDYDSTDPGSSYPYRGNGKNLAMPLLVKTTVETADLGISDRRAYHYRNSVGDNDHRYFGESTEDQFPWLELLFENEDISRIESELSLTIDQLARWRSAEGAEDFDEDSETTGVDAEAVRGYATLRLNARPVNAENERFLPFEGADRWPIDGNWAKPGHRPLFLQGSHGQYLVNRRSEVVNGEPFGAGDPYSEAHSVVAMATIRRDDESVASYALHKLIQFPGSYDESAMTGWPDRKFENFFNWMCPRNPSVLAHPYRWFGYSNDIDDGETPWAYITNGAELGGSVPFYTAGNLARARWITVVDEFDSRGVMVAGGTNQPGDDATYDSDAYKPGLRHRRVIEMNPAGYTLRDREWFYTDTGVDLAASGLGEEFIYTVVEDYFGSQLPDTSSAPPDGNDDYGWVDPLDNIRNDLLLLEHRSIGWSAADRNGQGDNEGLVSFYEYGLYDGGGAPACEWVQRSAVGLKRGRAYLWDELAGTIAPNPSGGPRLYQRQYFRDDTQPGSITTEVEFLTPVTTLLSSEPAIGATPTDDLAIHSIDSEYASGDDEELLSRLVVGPGRRTRPGGPYLFPVEREFYDDCGNVTWSFSGLVENPQAPAGGTPDSDEILTGTYYHDRDSLGRSKHTVLDAEPSASITAEFGPGTGDDELFTIGAAPSTGWTRIGSTPALNYVTSFRYDNRTEQLTDIFFPSGRRWAKRSIRWNIYDSMGEIENYFVREYVFNNLSFDRTETGPSGDTHYYESTVTGEVNDLPLGSSDPLGVPETRRRVEFKTAHDAAPATFDIDFILQDDAPPFVENFQVDMAIDANGRITAGLLEPDSTGALLAVGSKEINDLGEVFREREIDGTITRLTRDAIGQTLRTYIGTDDAGWVNPGTSNMVLIERTEYGSSTNDAWKPTVTRKYRSHPTWGDDYHDAPPSSDSDGIATETRYDWRGRPVRVDSYAKGDIATATRLETTLTYFDHADRPKIMAIYGTGALMVQAMFDPELMVDADALPDAATLYDFGLQPIAVTEYFYDSTGNAYETRQYDPSWSSGGGGQPPFLASYAYTGYQGSVVFSMAPEAPLQLTRLDGVGRVASELTVDPLNTAFELSRTDYTYDTDGNAVQVRSYVRTDDTGNVLSATGTSPNAVRTRTVSWYDSEKRMIAQADLGTERNTWTSGAESFSYNSGTAPSFDDSTGLVDRAGLPSTARLWVTAYHEGNGQVQYEVDPAGVVTELVYDNAGRLEQRIENTYAATDSLKRVTTYRYQYGRLVGMVTPRRVLGSDTTGEHHEATAVEYGAQIVDSATYLPVSEHNGLIGKVYLRQDGDPDPSSPTWYSGLSPDIELTYTFEGRVATRTDARDITFRYRYDDVGRLESVEVGYGGASSFSAGYPSNFWAGSTAPGGLVTYVEFDYDDAGSLTDVTAWDQQGGSVVSHIQRSHNDRHQIVSEWQQLDQLVDTQSSPLMAYTWDYQDTSDAFTGLMGYSGVQGSGSIQPGFHRLGAMSYPGAPAVQLGVDLDYGAAGSVTETLSRLVGMDITAGTLPTVRALDLALAGDGRRLSTTRADGVLIQDFRTGLASGDAGAPGLGRFGAAKDLHFANLAGDTLYRSQQKYDVRGNLWSMDVDQASAPTDPPANQRSQVFGYDELNRLVKADMGSIVFQFQTGDPSIHPAQLFRADTWNYDSVGNWAGTEHWADINGDDILDYNDTQPFLALWVAEDPIADVDGDGDWDSIDVDLFMLAIQEGEAPGRNSIGNLDGWGTAHVAPGADSTEDIFQTTHHIGVDNAIDYTISREGGSSGVTVNFEHDEAGNLTFDGRYYFEYDAWNRLVRILEADDDGQSGFIPGDMVRNHTYDGLGRLVRTRFPQDGTDTPVHEYIYDGARRVQEYTGVEGSALSLDREYVWGAGDGGMDELIVQVDSLGIPWWPIQNSAGDIVALCDEGGTNGDARVVGQWNYDPYGEVVTAEHLHAFPVQRVGHKGLFIDRLDQSPGASTEPPRLAPFAHAMYQNRNRAYVPTYGRFLQRDPNQTAMQLLSGSYHGRGAGAVSLAFSLEGWYGDGFNLYQYMRSNPLLRRDPMGLSSDPFDWVDDYLAESAGSRAAFLSKIGKDALAAATTAATIASWLPIPGISQLGDLGLYALGEQSGGATAAAIGLGLIPGGKLAGKLGGLIGKIGASAWQTAKKYANAGGGGFLARRAASSGDDLSGSLAQRAKDFVDRKPNAVACGCFTAATLVWTPAGAVPIGDIEQGAEVFAAPEDGQPSDLAGASVATKIVVSEASLVLLTVRHADGAVETIHTTDEHPFHDADTDEWVRADALIPGDQLSAVKGEAVVLSIAYLGQRVPVYNLSIPGSPTFFVGERGVWVHNCTPTRNTYRKYYVLATGTNPDAVHHRLPQRYEYLFPDQNIHELWNLRGVDATTHTAISRQWTNFANAHPSPTAEQVRSWADVLDGMFGWAMESAQ